MSDALPNPEDYYELVAAFLEDARPEDRRRRGRASAADQILADVALVPLPGGILVTGEDQDDITEAFGSAQCIDYDYSTITNQCCACFTEVFGDWICLTDRWQVDPLGPVGTQQLRYQTRGDYLEVQVDTQVFDPTFVLGSAGAWVRGGTWDTGVAANISSGGLVAWYQNGVLQDSALSTFVSGATLRLAVVGAVVSVYYNNVVTPVLTGTTTVTAAGYVGLWAASKGHEQTLVIEDFRCLG